jgi:site-specific DNA recombinase
MNRPGPASTPIHNRRLIIDKAAADTVRTIYRRYLEVSSIRLLVDELRERGITTRRSGGRGGLCFGRGSLNHLLRNPLYIGEIHFKGAVYAGQHKPILERDLWQQVQAKLTKAAAEKLNGTRAAAPSLLSGLLRDPLGRKLSPTHGCKKGQRYRYYVTAAGQYETTNDPFRFSAPAIEKVVTDQLVTWLSDATVHSRGIDDASTVSEAIRNASADAVALESSAASEKRFVLLQLVDHIDLSDSGLTIHLKADGHEPLTARLGRVRRGNDVRLIVKPSTTAPSKPRNEELVHMLADARAAQHLVLSKPSATLALLAASADRSERVFKRMLRLSYLAPEVAKAILEGDEPSSMTCRGLHRVVGIPIAWDEQRRFFALD